MLTSVDFSIALENLKINCLSLQLYLKGNEENKCKNGVMYSFCKKVNLNICFLVVRLPSDCLLACSKRNNVCIAKGNKRNNLNSKPDQFKRLIVLQ